MAPISQTDICNLALGHLAQRPIQIITEASPAANACLRIWDAARREALRGHDWSFATTIRYLALVKEYTVAGAVVPAHGFLYEYAYPSDVVALWHVYNESTQDRTSGEVFRELLDADTGLRIVGTNIAYAIGECTYDLEDTSLYDANFVNVLSYLLAAKLANALCGDQELAKAMMVIYNSQMSEAERMSSYENNDIHGSSEQSSLIDARG